MKWKRQKKKEEEMGDKRSKTVGEVRRRKWNFERHITQPIWRSNN